MVCFSVILVYISPWKDEGGLIPLREPVELDTIGSTFDGTLVTRCMTLVTFL